MYEELKTQAVKATEELLEVAKLNKGDILVVGCSSSEVVGANIGKDSNEDAAAAVFSGIYKVLKTRGIHLAAQCCEHLNRALIIERAAAREYGFPEVNAVPQKHAGGSFAMQAYANFEDPIAVEDLKCRARAGLDIGDTFIGMHMDRVCVPVRLSLKEIGKAHLTACRVRPKYVGGDRAVYNPELK